MRPKRFVCSLVTALCGIGFVVVTAVPAQADAGSALVKQTATPAEASNVSKDATATSPQPLTVNKAPPSSDNSDAQQPKQVSPSTAKKPSKLRNKPAANFKQLDSETESALSEVMDLSSDLAILDEQQNNPPQNQVVVLVTLQPNEFFELDTIELTVDNRIVAAHPYSEKDISALSKGGGHRLYLANLPAGKHEMIAKLVGKIPRDPDYRQEANYTFITGVNRTLLELYINNGDNNGYPQLTVREWD